MYLGKTLKILAPFHSRNFRLYFGGQWVSLVGSWMTNTATVWVVYELTRSPMWLAVVGLATQLPSIVLGPFAGVLIDRVDRLRLLMATQCLAMVHASLLAVFMLSGVLNVWMILGLALFQGVIASVDMPTRQSMAVLLAERREDLSGVIALNASMFHLARLIGPAIAGIVIATFGAGVCFTLDAVSYIAVLIALIAMRLPAGKSKVVPLVAGVMAQLREGVRYVIGSFPIRTHVLLSGGMAAFTLSYATLMPQYADVFFGGDARTLGILLSSAAAGALTAALYLAGRARLAGIGSAITTGAIMSGIGLWGFAVSRELWISCVCLAVAGGGGILVMASNNTLIQSMLEDDKRGRVMSLYTVVFFGGFPLGGLLNGWLAARFGPAVVPAFAGTAALGLAAIYVRMRPHLRVDIKRILHAQSAQFEG